MCALQKYELRTPKAQMENEAMLHSCDLSTKYVVNISIYDKKK